MRVPTFTRHELTERELDVLRLVALGLTNREIARALQLSPETVQSHLQRARRKMGASDRWSLVLFTIDAGIVDLADCVAAAERRASERKIVDAYDWE